MAKLKLIYLPLVVLSLLILLSFEFIQASHVIQVHYCDEKGDDYMVKVQGVEITPNPVARGLPAIFTISASSGNSIDGGKVTIDVSFFGVHVHSEINDLCQETSCPISAGHFVLSHSQVLPGFAPPGSYTLKMKMEDGNKHQLTCITFNFSIGFGLSVADS